MNRIEERITKLKYLRELNFSDNTIKTLPLELGNLSNLSVLIVKGNQIEEIPEQLFNGKFKDSLVNLDLSNNNISELPFSIGKLKKLKILNLSRNKLVQLPYSFGRLRKLQELRVAKNEISYFPLTMLHMKLKFLDFNCVQRGIENVMADNATGRVPHLVELAAASCVKQGLDPQPSDIPYTLCSYIDKYKICLTN
ncbi:Leucine-rich repeat protein 1 [Armadillidium vulgare]|nr:Leucine-rich repeat protein 1 [Armadillidium vulgare]